MSSASIISSDVFATDYSGDLLRDVAIAFTVLETVAVGLRFVSLRLSEKEFGIDDCLTIPGYLCCLGLIILSFVGINFGQIGHHVGFVALNHFDSLAPLGKCLYATPILYGAACCFTRLTLLTLYLRIFKKHRPYRIACYALMALLISHAIAVILVGVFICMPISSMWSLNVINHPFHCVNLERFYRWGTVPNPVLDAMILVLPQPIVWKLQLPRQAKIGLAVTFLTGSVGMVTSICRCVYFYISGNPLSDSTWLSVTYLKWSIIETGVYLIAACLPCYRPLIKLIIERGHGRSISESSRNHAKSSTPSTSSSGGTSHDKPPQIPIAVIDSNRQANPEMSSHGFDRQLTRSGASDEESLFDPRYGL